MLDVRNPISFGIRVLQNENGNDDNKKEDAVGLSHAINNGIANERCDTESAERTSSRQARTSSSIVVVIDRDEARSKELRQHKSQYTKYYGLSTPGCQSGQGGPKGSGYWQLTERNARQQHLERHRREASIRICRLCKKGDP